MDQDYKQNLQIDKDLAFEKQPFALKNFSLRECTLNFYENRVENGKRIRLKPRDDKPIFIPMHVAKNEAVNQVIADKLQFRHAKCRIQAFASKVVNKLLILDKYPEDIIFCRSSKQQSKLMHKFRMKQAI